MRTYKRTIFNGKGFLLFLAVSLVLSLFAVGNAPEVRADSLEQNLTVDFNGSTEVYVSFNDIVVDFFQNQNSLLHVTVNGAAIDVADWVFQDPEEALHFETNYLSVQVLDESHFDFSLRLRSDNNVGSCISVEINGKDGQTYWIRFYVPGLTHQMVYDKNCDEDVSGMPDPLYVKYNQGYVVYRPTNIPVRNGYDFVGWSKAPNVYYGVFDSSDIGTADSYVTTVYAFWERSKGSPEQKSDSSEQNSGDSEESSGAAYNGVITCQMAGYPEGYEWNEAAQACQLGILREDGVFLPTRKDVPDTADR